MERIQEQSAQTPGPWGGDVLVPQIQELIMEVGEIPKVQVPILECNQEPFQWTFLVKNSGGDGEKVATMAVKDQVHDRYLEDVKKAFAEWGWRACMGLNFEFCSNSSEYFLFLGSVMSWTGGGVDAGSSIPGVQPQKN